MDFNSLNSQPDSKLLMSYGQRFPRSRVPPATDPEALPTWFRTALVQALLTNQPSERLEELALKAAQQAGNGATF